MARRREVNYFKDISSDEELENFLQQKGLLVLDVYQDLFGPTISLQGWLTKVKLALTDSDKLQFGVCDAYKVPKLKRFKSKCQPTMIFCSHGSIVEIVYGSNIPLLLRALHNQLELEELCETGSVTRELYDFDEPLPFEMAEIERKRAEEEAQIKAETDRLEAELHAKLDEAIETFLERADDQGVTLFLPHVANDGFKKCEDSAYWLGLIKRRKRTVRIDASAMTILNYKLDNPMPAEILEQIYDKDMVAVLWERGNDVNESIEKLLDDFVRKVSEPQLSTGNDIVPAGIIQPRILKPLIIYLDDNSLALLSSSTTSTDDNKSNRSGSINRASLDDPNTLSRQSQVLNGAERISMSDRRSIATVQQRISMNNVRVSRATLLSRTMLEDEDDDRPKLVIPAVFTPANQEGNAMFMYHFFRSEFSHFLAPEVEPDPEHILMAFPASKRVEIFELCQLHPNELLAFGFFTSADFRSTKLICKTLEHYEKLASKQESDRILMKVALRTDEFVLALTAMHIVYVSMNASTGAQECKIVFDEKFEAAKDAVEEDEDAVGEQHEDIRQRRSSVRRPSKPPRLSEKL